ncbi:putative bifunctional diguanylate cyclase/phosphodiesterase [Novilysobacter spongiicola]|uniref:Diguanylate cyclase (GGDEF) domain-containing protein n=1 Tax=Lysobacter spongiicola DSM 21749 TaxID=1122188 RepID=A0A1T4RQW2_9GAMM|nr:bifunctional diguanylate cyclase/phosphodiesterase [Lysobacter spongiicola]SKA18379.1 diguanylate cyclase (GGDEF) domain-containing protein [Lysobacter spongiicola DSM 21749]
MNRGTLATRLDELLEANPCEEGRTIGVMLVRLQRLREFRLVYGFAAGDAVSSAACEAMREALRPSDEIHRISEDEFAVLLPCLRGRNHAALAGSRVVRAFEAPLQLGHRAALASVAVGISISPEHGVDAESLLRRAELAYGEAARHTERSVVYSAENEPVLVPYELLRDAITGNQLEVYLQPILDLRQHRLTGAEALSRWHDPQLGQVSPDNFIGLAEDTGLISDLTRWNLNASLRHLARARRQVPDMNLSVNLSPRMFAERDIAVQIASALDVWDASPEAVTLEVTENALMEDPALSLRLLTSLRDRGFGISIDDFGSGYSSLAYLKQFPATELKIDRSFVMDMQSDARSVQLVRSMIDLGHHLQMHVVAEGVEDATTLELLTRMGCDRAQGYHIRRPQPAADFVASLEPQNR